ncbi:DUF721 domain-containing protein [Cellulomonas telluris]|uniref:DUF721 domain-containing protein n=1 Tax=Cellulomonas telluris TaxID=2306636 RepID=UPI0010A7EB3B|nr:DciA family protein [Cellulomonas telluris]
MSSDPRAGRGDAGAGDTGAGDDALLPPPTVVPDGVPVSELVALTPPEQVARTALARAKAAARARGLRPGQAPRGTVASSGAAPGPRDPQPLSVSAGLLARDLGWEPGLVVGDLVHRWVHIVGPQVAEHCTYESFEAGLLTVRASSTAWAANLRLLAPAMLARFDEALGPGVVVQVDVLGPVGHGFGRGPKRVQGRGPRDTWG